MIRSNFSFRNTRDWLFIISSLAILTGFALTIISWLNICTEECAAVHNYRLHGWRFEAFGFIFFPLLIIFHFSSRFYEKATYAAAALLMGATGAELMFVFAQKYIIRHWCPVCLSIAASVGIAAIVYGINYFLGLTSMNKEGKRREVMFTIWKGIASLSIIAAGFLFAATGIAKFNPLQAEENSIKDSLSFGNPNSSIEVYVFTDWACPACRKVEPTLVKIAPEIMRHAKLTFVDFAIHPTTLNFTPYNLAFMVHSKDKYLEVRDALTRLAIETATPNDQDIERLAKGVGTQYQQLNYADIALGIKYYKHLGNEFGISSTPTMVIINRQEKKGKKLYGPGQITQTNVMNAIELLTK